MTALLGLFIFLLLAFCVPYPTLVNFDTIAGSLVNLYAAPGINFVTIYAFLWIVLMGYLSLQLSRFTQGRKTTLVKCSIIILITIASLILGSLKILPREPTLRKDGYDFEHPTGSLSAFGSFSKRVERERVKIRFREHPEEFQKDN